MLQGRVQGMSGRDLRERADELLELVGIADAADRIVKTYSGGMRRRLDIALGLVHRPRVLFLDEPTTGLDPEARVAMWAEVSRLAAGGVADDPADDALPRGGRPARRPARDRLAGQGRRRGHAGRAEGTGCAATPCTSSSRTARSRTRSACSRASARRPSRCSTGARSSRASRTAGARCRGSSRRSTARASASRRSPSRGRRSTTSTSTSPAATSARRIAAMTVLRHTWFMTVRQARNLMREPIWIVLLLVQPMVWLVLYGQLFKQRDAARRLRHRLVHHVPRARDRRHERVLRRDVERDVDDRRPRPQGRRALPRDAGVALRDRALADRALRADRGDPGGRDPARLARARRARAHRRRRLARDHPRGDPRQQRVRRDLAGDRTADAARGDDDRRRELHRPAAALPLDDDDRAGADARLDADRREVQPGRLGRQGSARGRAARNRWSSVGWYLFLLLALSAVTAAWATSTFRSYQRSL